MRQRVLSDMCTHISARFLDLSRPKNVYMFRTNSGYHGELRHRSMQFLLCCRPVVRLKRRKVSDMYTAVENCRKTVVECRKGKCSAVQPQRLYRDLRGGS